MARNVLVQVAGTLLGRVLGVGRDLLIAAQFGASSLTDAYTIALSFPTFLNNVVAGATLQAAMMPTLARYRSQANRGELWLIVSTAINTVLLFSGSAAILLLLFAEPLIAATWPHLDEPTAHLAGNLLRVLAFVFVANALLNVVFGVLAAFESFATAALISPALNLAIISSMLIGASVLGIAALAVGVVIGTVMQLLLQLPSLAALGFTYRAVVRFRHPEVRSIVQLFVPLMVASILAQFHPLIDRWFGAFLPPGTIASLSFGETVSGLVFMLSVPVANATFPVVTALASAGNTRDACSAYARASRLLFFWSLPLTATLTLFPVPTIQAVYERGYFDSSATAITAAALQFYAVGTLCFALHGLATKLFYALSDARWPLVIAVTSAILHAVLAFLMMPALGVRGLALATCATWIAALLTDICVLRAKLDLGVWRQMLKPALTALTATFPLLILSTFQSIPTSLGGLPSSGYAALAIPIGLGAYFVLAWLWRVEELSTSFDLAKRVVPLAILRSASHFIDRRSR